MMPGKKGRLRAAFALIAAAGLASVLALAWAEAVRGGVCPPLAGVPACYVLTFVLAGALAAHLAGFRAVSLAAAAAGLLIALNFSYLEATGAASCPRCLVGFPLCYAALLMFALLLLLKTLEIKPPSAGNYSAKEKDR